MALPNHYSQARVLFRSPQKDTAINVLWYEHDGAPADPQVFADAMAAQLDIDIAGLARACLTVASAYVGMYVITNTTGGAFTGFANANAGVGTSGGDELPSYAAAVIQKRTSVGGKQGRGRWFVPFVPELFTDESLIEGASLAQYDLLGTAYMDSFIITGVACTASHFSPNLDTMYPILSVNALVVLGTQRRRRLRGSY